MDSTIASASKNRIIAFPDSLPHLIRDPGFGERGGGSGINSGSLQNFQNLRGALAPMSAPGPGKRIVEQEGFAHELEERL